MKAEFTIYGNPAGKGRPRFSTRGGHITTRTPQETVLYENLVRTEYRAQTGGIKFPDGKPVCVEITAYYDIPQSVSKKERKAMLDGVLRPVKKPDADNIAKIICDSLNGIAYHDDAQIAELVVWKFYAELPKVEVCITGEEE